MADSASERQQRAVMAVTPELFTQLRVQPLDLHLRATAVPPLVPHHQDFLRG